MSAERREALAAQSRGTNMATYTVNNTKEFFEAFSKAVPGDCIWVVVGDKTDFEFSFEPSSAPDPKDVDWKGCCC